MLKVGLTGNIGSGKTTVAEIFGVLGAKVFNADNVAKQLYYREDVIASLVEIFSSVILTASKEIDKARLASIIFNDDDALKKINSIIHPLVLQSFNEWCSLHQNEPYVIHETAILFENNLQKNFDLVINVSAPVNLRVKRVRERDGISTEDIMIRVNNQLPDEEKCKLSDYVIVNDETTFLTPQVLSIHKDLLSGSI